MASAIYIMTPIIVVMKGLSVAFITLDYSTATTWLRFNFNYFAPHTANAVAVPFPFVQIAFNADIGGYFTRFSLLIGYFPVSN